MTDRASASVLLASLDGTIARAEAACDRYRQAAAKQGLSPWVAANRQRMCGTMEATLAGLRAQRAAAAKG